MTFTIYILVGILFLVVIALLEYYVMVHVNSGTKLLLYHIILAMNDGSKVKLVLNEEQYTAFRTWLNKDMDLYEIREGDEYYLAINRLYLSTVEVKKR